MFYVMPGCHILVLMLALRNIYGQLHVYVGLRCYMAWNVHVPKTKELYDNLFSFIWHGALSGRYQCTVKIWIWLICPNGKKSPI